METLENLDVRGGGMSAGFAFFGFFPSKVRKTEKLKNR